VPKTATKRSVAVVTRIPKDDVRGPLCLMDRWSGCRKRQHDDPNDSWRRDVCDADYQILYNMAAVDKVIKWEEAEEAGMCAPRKRATSKRILTTILARRTA